MKKILIILLLLFISINVAIIFKTPLVSWDEAVYIGIGKFIFSNAQSGLFESFRPLFLSFILGGIWKLGLNAVSFGRAIVLLFSAGNLILFYLIAKKYTTKNLAIMGLIIFALVPIYFDFSTKIMTGVVASFFVLLSFYYFLKGKYSLVAFFSGLATLTRFPAGIFFIFFLLWSLKKKKFIFIKMIFLFLITISPFFLVNIFFGNGLIKPLLDAISHQNNYVFSQDFFFYPKLLFLSSIFLVFSLPGLYYSIKNKRYELFFFSIIPLLYFTYIVNKQLRFVNLFLPFVVLIAVYGFYHMLKKSKTNPLNSLALLLFVLISLGISVNMISDVKFDSNIGPYEFFSEKGLTIITGNPIFTAYSDNKFIPVYFDVYKGYDSFVFYQDQVDYYILSDVYPCETYLDPESCKRTKNELINKFLSKNYVETIQQYYIFD